MIYTAILPALVILWTTFLAYSSLKTNWSTLRPEVKAVGTFVVLCGFLLDVIINWTIGLVLGVTKDFTLSQKCKRIKKYGGWQGEVATYLCANWLNPFDSEHC